MNEQKEQKTYRARDTRQGDIILRTLLRKTIFIAGLVGFVLLALMLSFL
ncbi:peptide ABC transporter permease [Nitratireductor luteus]|nr:peptide ABC transporter permease [Nitratireductor luteus]